MIRYKSHKETANTFSITFDISGITSVNDIKRLKALIILTGGFNAVRVDIKDEEKMRELVESINDGCLLDNLLYDVTELIRG